MKILLIEDELEILDSIIKYMQTEGFICESASTFFDALDKIILYQYSIILLDLTLPGGNGINLISEIKRVQPETGILIISAKHSLDDKLKGLDLGADDYITKPFHLAELSARINAIMRRKDYSGKTNLIFNEIEINTTRKEVFIHGNDIMLTKKEYALLLYIIVNKKRVLTKEAIAEHLNGDDIDMADHFDFIYTHIRNLRKKIETFGGKDYLQTVYGIGYKFTDQ